ncbi:FRG domain-containing protein [Pseudoflavonifractor sp. An187]|uniref:FRG domain-containing protein n=1 Tax=Pseudoflavonifractor sp. An187 TaxID=1965578 RepID=UPI000B37A482|nr:FRG domain-containing protein [Pseudoflavonifractor sp. An187]OUP44834.1 hypothetical protein B5F22_06350 [Pseudoflavonifractor sp. An187]
MGKAIEGSNANFEMNFYKLLELPLVKKSFDDIIYRKLLIDGYIYCNDGIIPSNKTVFKPLDTINPALYSIVKDKNPDSYEELYNQIKSYVPAENREFSNLEAQLILYLIFQLGGPCATAKVLIMLYRYYENKIKYRQYGGFICRLDVEPRPINSLHDYIKHISELSDVKNLFYRGHSNVNYIAIPSLFREKRFYQNEYIMYQELVIRCASSFINCSTHLDFLIEMQHYGLPTRLLDITSNPLVALYFSCESSNNVGEVIVYNIGNSSMKYEKCDEVSILTALPMFDFSTQQSILHDVHFGSLLSSRSYEALISEIKTERPLLSDDVTYRKLTTPVFVKPVRKNSRILRQEGAFLIWGLDDVHYGDGKQRASFDEEFRYKEDMKKIVYYVPSKYKKSIIDSLNRVGINKAFVYPEIDDVAVYIKESIK